MFSIFKRKKPSPEPTKTYVSSIAKLHAAPADLRLEEEVARICSECKTEFKTKEAHRNKHQVCPQPQEQ